MDEALGFCTRYMQGCPLTQQRVWDNKEDPTVNDEIVEGNGQQQALTVELRKQIHKIVLNNADSS